MLPTVLLIGRPIVGKSALFNRLIRRREALVYNTPNDHVTRDIREGIAKLSDLRFRVLDSAGLEAEASSGSALGRIPGMTENVLKQSQLALFLIGARPLVVLIYYGKRWWLKAEDPFQCLATCINLSEALRSSSPESTLSYIPIHQRIQDTLRSAAESQHDVQTGREVSKVEG